MTQSGYLSRSTTKGTADNFNQLRFEDKKDSEEVYFHAEKDFNRVVENNDTLKVGFDKKDKGDQTIQIYNNHAQRGGGKTQAADGSQTITVFNNQSLTVGDAAASERQPDDHHLQGPHRDRQDRERNDHDREGNRSVTSSRATTSLERQAQGNRAGQHRHGQRHADHQDGQPDDQARPRRRARPRPCSRSR